MKNILIKNSLITFVALSAFGGSQLIFNIFVGKFFGPEFLGESLLVINTSFLISFFLTSGLVPSGTKYVSESLGQKNLKKSKEFFSISFFICFALLFLAILIVLLFGKNVINILNIKESLLIPFTIIFIFYTFYIFFRGMFYSFNKILEYTIMEVISNFIFLIMLAYVLITRNNLLLPYIIIYPIFSFISILILKKFIVKSFSKKNFKKIIEYSLISFIGTFSSQARIRLSILFPSFFLPLQLIGYFGAAFTFLNLFYYLPRTFSMVINPLISFSYGQKNKKNIKKIFGLTYKYLIIYSFIIMGCTIIVSEYILKLFFGETYEVVKIPLQILCISVILTIISSPALSTLSGTKYVSIPNISSLTGLFLSIISWIILIPKLGLIGISLGFLAGTTIEAIIPLYFVRKKFDVDLHLFLIFKQCMAFGLCYILFKNNDLFFLISFVVLSIFINIKEAIRLIKLIINARRN